MIAGSLSTIEGALVSAQVQPATEVVTTPFPIGNGKITIPAGTYHVLGTQFDLTSPPTRDFVFGIHYSGGRAVRGHAARARRDARREPRTARARG